jgi:hypothetical protein
MKKIIPAFLLAACFGVCQAQVTLPQTDPTKTISTATDFIKPPAIGDIGSTANGIVDMPGSNLSLPDAQKPKLTDAISGFLTKKKDIAGLADTNPTDYLSKFNPLQKGLFGKMKGIMGAAKFSKFLGLKPSGSGIAGNALSNLFF